MIRVTVLGSGNVGFHMINLFDNSKKIKLHEWYSRSLKFDSRVKVVNEISGLTESDVYIICVNDDSIAEVSDKIPREKTLLAVIGRGSSDPDANSNVTKVTRMLWEGLGLGWAETAYSGVTFPLVEPGLEHASRLGYRRIIVFPYFLFTLL